MIRIAAIALAAACAPPALLPDLATAEDHVHAGRFDDALAAYDRAIESCRGQRDRARARQTCAHAHLGRAELLDRMGRKQDAAAAYEATPAAIDREPDASCTAVYRAGKLRLELGEEVRGYELLWQAIADYPDASSADWALRELVRDGRRRNAAQLYGELGKLAARLADTEAGDNLLYAMADLARDELGDPVAARSLYDQLADRYPTGALFDDALWHGAQLALAAHDARGAIARWRKLLATYEASWLNGTYNSEWFDDAWLQMGVTLRDDLRDYAGALTAFGRIAKYIPHSLLLDDAAFERAVTYERMGDPRRACTALAALKKRWPDSRFELERAPALRARLECAPTPPSPRSREGQGGGR